MLTGEKGTYSRKGQGDGLLLFEVELNTPDVAGWEVPSADPL